MIKSSEFRVCDSVIILILGQFLVGLLELRVRTIRHQVRFFEKFEEESIKL